MPFKADYSIAVATPLWGPDNLLFVSAEYNAGAKVIELQRNGLQTTATELWSSNRLRLHHGNAMRIGDAIYFSSGGKGSQADSERRRRAQRQDPLAGAQHRKGDVRVGRSEADHARSVDGTLMIAYPSPQGFKIAAKAPLLTRLAWTPPVLVGTRLYMRDRRIDDGRRPELMGFEADLLRLKLRHSATAFCEIIRAPARPSATRMARAQLGDPRYYLSHMTFRRSCPRARGHVWALVVALHALTAATAAAQGSTATVEVQLRFGDGFADGGRDTPADSPGIAERCHTRLVGPDRERAQRPVQVRAARTLPNRFRHGRTPDRSGIGR